MNLRLIRLLFWNLTSTIVTLVSVQGTSYAQEIAVNNLGYRTPYRVAKPVLQLAFRSGSSLDERRSAVIKAAEVAYGSRGKTALGNSVDVLARTPGGLKIARELTIMNPSNRKGALRTARVAGSFDADARYKVVALEQLVFDRKGKLLTDRDLVFRHRVSGSLGRIEVKDATPSTQRSSLTRYMRQISLMAAEQNRTGQPQAFVNRRPLIPELRDYAASKGVRAYGNVVTSTSAIGKADNVSVQSVLDDLDREATRSFRVRAATTGFGIVMVAIQGREAYNQWHQYGLGNGSATEAGYHTMMTSAGGAYVIGGVSSTLATMKDASSRSAEIFGRVGKVAPWVGAGLLVGGTAIQGYQYYSGEINSRQFTTTTASAGGGLAGGLAGAAGGAYLGVYGGPWAWATVPAGAIVGGIAGSWTGQTIATYGIESYYSFLDADQQQQLLAALIQHYHSQSL